MIINTIVQARMRSVRFPGKVMASVGGKPLIGHLLDNIAGAITDKTIVAIPLRDEKTSLGKYLRSRNDISVTYGPEMDVAGRFCIALREHPCDAFIRVCADSPLLNYTHINYVCGLLGLGNFAYSSMGLPGTQLQGISTDIFQAYVDSFNEEEREHVLSFFTKRWSMVVDTPGDLERIKPLLENNRMEVAEWMTSRLPA